MDVKKQADSLNKFLFKTFLAHQFKRSYLVKVIALFIFILSEYEMYIQKLNVRYNIHIK